MLILPIKEIVLNDHNRFNIIKNLGIHFMCHWSPNEMLKLAPNKNSIERSLSSVMIKLWKNSIGGCKPGLWENQIEEEFRHNSPKGFKLKSLLLTKTFSIVSWIFSRSKSGICGKNWWKHKTHKRIYGSSSSCIKQIINWISLTKRKEAI